MSKNTTTVKSVKFQGITVKFVLDFEATPNGALKDKASKFFPGCDLEWGRTEDDGWTVVAKRNGRTAGSVKFHKAVK